MKDQSDCAKDARVQKSRGIVGGKKPGEIQFPPEEPEIKPPEEAPTKTWPEKTPEIDPGKQPEKTPAPSEVPAPPTQKVIFYLRQSNEP
jgi:Predicted membrane protein